MNAVLERCSGVREQLFMNFEQEGGYVLGAAWTDSGAQARMRITWARAKVPHFHKSTPSQDRTGDLQRARLTS